jgi:hypothetical protein
MPTVANCADCLCEIVRQARSRQKRCAPCQKAHEGAKRALYRQHLREIGECSVKGCQTQCQPGRSRCEPHRLEHREAERARRPESAGPIRIVRCGWCRKPGHFASDCEAKARAEAEVAAMRGDLAQSRVDGGVASGVGGYSNAVGGLRRPR